MFFLSLFPYLAHKLPLPGTSLLGGQLLLKPACIFGTDLLLLAVVVLVCVAVLISGESNSASEEHHGADQKSNYDKTFFHVLTSFSTLRICVTTMAWAPSI